MRSAFALICASCLSSIAWSLEIERVTDRDSGPISSGSLTVFDGLLYFAANDLPHGNNTELWRYDGETVRQAADVRPGPEGSSPHDLTVYDGTLYFVASGDRGPPRLWRFDGETASPAPGASTGAQNPGDLTVFRGAVYFRAYQSEVGSELWRFDGAEQTVIDIYPGRGSSYPQHLVEYDDALYFSCNATPGQGAELCRFDGEIASQVSNLRTDGGSSPSSLTVYDGGLYFAANDGVHGNELWRYLGGAAELVADIMPGGPYDSGNPSNLSVFDGALYFSADNGIDGFELWRHDGGGTTMVADVNPTPFVPGIDPVHDSYPSELFPHNGLLYFSADDGEHGRELFSWNGQNVRLVADIYPGPTGSRPSSLAAFRGSLFFSADDGGGEWSTALFRLTDLPPLDNWGFESGVLAPWVLTGSGAVVHADFFVPAIPPRTGTFMGYISTLNNEFLVNIPRIDLDGDGEVEREFSSLALDIHTTQAALVSFDLNFLTDELSPDGAVNDSDLFGVTTHSVIDGPYELLFAVAPTDGSYVGRAEEVTAEDFTDEFIEEIQTFGRWPTILDRSQYKGQTGFRSYSMTVAPGDHTVTFFVADSHTDGVATGMLIDNFTVTAVPEASGTFRRGDCNDDGGVDISDAVFSLGSLFLGREAPGCDDACDTNDDGTVDISDAINTLGVLFLGHGVTPLPGMAVCGEDPTDDEVSCVEYSGCP